MKTIRTFRIKSEILRTLSKNEKRLMPILVSAVKDLDEVYRLQEDHINNGANFYPRDAVKDEILKAFKKNHKILSPFTIVKRDINHNLVAVNYHDEYQKLLFPIHLKLTKAAKICENKSFKNYLEVVAKSLISGSYSQADEAWLKVKNSNIDIIIGPFERYLDKLFFVKRAYQGCVCIIDHEKSKKATQIRDILYSTISPNKNRIISPTVTEVQVRNAIIFSGFLGRVLFTQQHLPADSDSVEKYGSRILGYETSLNYKFEKLIYPIYNAVFEKKFRQRYTKEQIRKGCYYHVLLNGIIQHLHRFKNSRTRLRELFPIFDEASAAACSIHHAKYLILKGVIDQKELEAIMIARICWVFSELVFARENNSRDVYLKGDAMIYNFLQREGALLEKDGISWPNFAKMFFEMENLSSIFTHILEEGTHDEAQDFLSKYLSQDVLAAFEPRLSKIEPI